MLPFATKLQYVLTFAVLGAFMPFVPAYLHDLGLDDAQVGWFMGLPGLAVLIVPAVAGAIADRRASGRSLIAAGHFWSGVSLLWIAQADHFAALLTLSLALSIGLTAIVPLLDTLTLASQSGENRDQYHRFRIWGTVGFILPSIGLPFVLDTHGTEIAIYLAAAIAFSASLASALLPPSRTRGQGWPTTEAWRTIVAPKNRAIMAAAFLLSMAAAIIYAFYPRHLQELGVAPRWFGPIVNLGVVVELFFIAGSGFFTRRLGYERIMAAGAAAMAIRMGLLAWQPSVTVAVVTQILHGPSVLALYVSLPVFLDSQAGDGHRNSIQGLRAALFAGVGRIIASGLGGHVAVTWGLEATFATAAVFSILAVVILRGGRSSTKVAAMPGDGELPRNP